MKADRCDWCLAGISTFHNIAEKSVPYYGCELLAVGSRALRLEINQENRKLRDEG